MLDNIKLYIDDQEVDFGDDPKVFYNWQLTDFTNPTATKNSYSKTLTLPGTDRNNDVFGHFWELDREQVYGGNTGVLFNPTYRVPFSLYVNGNLFEKGYIKLQKIKRKRNGECEYEVGLFGGLGTFLYNISTDWNSGEQKTLGDLQYYVADSATTLNFTINAATVKEAWENIDSYSSKWSVINFAPAYNGLNDKLETDKAVVNYRDMDVFVSGATEDDITYTTSQGWALAKLPTKLTEWETCDLRSWCQRPVVRCKAVLEAITKKENNKGRFDDGFDVVLDPEFFNSRNPYYEDSWMTLPMLSNLKIKTSGGTETSYAYNYARAYTGDSGNSVELVYNLTDKVELYGTTAELTFDLMVNVSDATLSSIDDKLYPSGAFDRRTKFCNVYAIQGLATQGLERDAKPLLGTEVKWCYYDREDKHNNTILSFSDAKNSRWYVPRYDVDGAIPQTGNFVRYNNKIYRWNTPITLSIPLPVGADSFRIRVDRVNNWRNRLGASFYLTNVNGSYYIHHPSEVKTGTTMPVSTLVSNRNFKIKTASLTNYYTNLDVSQKDLLSTSFSPGEWLMDYCRMYGLYVHKDLYDDKIYIDTRNTFFRRGNIKDISNKIDWGQGAEYSPTVCDKGFYRMKDSFWEGGAYKDYNEKYGKIYGSKVINTGYEFDAETKDLISSKLKACVQVRKDGKYYFKPMVYLHPFVWDGLTYSLYAGGAVSGDTKEMSIERKIIAEEFEPFQPDQPYYDIDDKPEFCDMQNKALDGSGVMLFRCGDTDLSGLYYWLTDDLEVMSRLNNNPCYIITASEYDKSGNRVAYALGTIPKFSRYYYSMSYVQGTLYSKNVWFSMDFGSPRQLYLLDYTDYETSNLYFQFYKKYYEDLYDVNTKALTLYFHPEGIMDSDWLRDFYWFKNTLWRLNKVSDYSPLSNDLVKCEFVKVQDLEDMTNIIPSKEVELTVVLDKYTIDENGGTITATVSTTDHGSWYVDNWDYSDEISISPLSRPTDGTFTITVPRYYGLTDRQVGISVAAGDIAVRVYFTQTPGAGSSIHILSNTPIPYDSTSIVYTATTTPGGTIKLVKNGAVIDTASVSSGTSVGTFTIPVNTGNTNVSWVLSGETSDSQATYSTTVVQNHYVAPPEPLEVWIDSLGLDTDHSDLTSWTLTNGATLDFYSKGNYLFTVGLIGDNGVLTLDGPSHFDLLDTDLGPETEVNVNFSNLSWNQFLTPDVEVTTSINGEDISVSWMQDGLAGGGTISSLSDWRSGAYIHLNISIRFRNK